MKKEYGGFLSSKQGKKEDFFHRNGEKIKEGAELFQAMIIIMGIAIMVTAVTIISGVDDDLLPLAIFVALVGFIAWVVISIFVTRLIYGFGELVANSYGNVCSNDTVKKKKTNRKTSMIYDDTENDEEDEDEEE